jgi:hypothetical protein
VYARGQWPGALSCSALLFRAWSMHAVVGTRQAHAVCSYMHMQPHGSRVLLIRERALQRWLAVALPASLLQAVWRSWQQLAGQATASYMRHSPRTQLRGTWPLLAVRLTTR